MVMKKKNVLLKSLLRTIRGSFGRYIAIMAIIILGSSIFVGLLSTKADMVATGQKFVQTQNMFDLRLLSTYGWSQAEVDKVAKMAGVEEAEGAVSMDVIGSRNAEELDAVYKVHTIPSAINKVNLLGGRMPQSPDECLVDGHNATDKVLGSTFTISEDNDQGTLDSIHYRTYTVVGYVSTPLYMDLSRGSTSIGSGVVSTYVYLPADALNVDYYTEIDVTLIGNYTPYTEAYDQYLKDMADELKDSVTVLAGERLVNLKADATKQYEDGYAEYEKGLAEYEEGRTEALAELDKGLKELEKAQKEIDENRKKLEDGLKELEAGQKELNEQREKLDAGRVELATAKKEAYAQLADAYNQLIENRKQVVDGLNQLNDGLKQIEEGLPLLDNGITQIEDGLTQLKDGMEKLELGITLADMKVKTLTTLLNGAGGPDATNAVAEGLKKELAAAQSELDGYLAQKDELIVTQAELINQLAELKKQRTEIVDQKAELLETEKTLNEAMATIDAGFVEVQNNKAMADSQFASAEAEIEAGQVQLDAAQTVIDANRTELDKGMSALNEGQAELDKGWAEYNEGKEKAEAELADAKQKLDDAAKELADAKSQIDGMTDIESFILDRNTNVGYLAVDNNSDIVMGVSRVFPAFFLLVASLVCITTMTRMVAEERTQIGTFKALGYSESAIIGKYLMYAGSAAVLGCGFGVLLGSVLLPAILWDVYGILLNVTPKLVLKLDVPLCSAVVVSYTVAMLAVTWFCCHRTLKEVPAELIRPKAPTSGKKIFMEYLPFWKRIGFLNKVMLRNIFRYRQRMLMMLLGIGGCTALLLTGFGLRDSIVNTVPHQYGEVALYDMEIYFGGGQNEEQQKAFREEFRGDVSGLHFFYQTSAELDSGDSTGELSMIITDSGITEFLNFKQGEELLPAPSVGEVYLTVGIAERMGIALGDTVTVRDSNMKSLHLRVGGIFANSVQNFAVVAPETIEGQWGYVPTSQMAYAKIRDYADGHEIAARMSKLDSVMNVTITQDMIHTVNNMLQALDTIVVVIVLFAAALAFIVLYNLTNININERVREIATIKVLGFRSQESAAYVFKENLMLTGMGMFLGLFMGKWLLDFVVSQIKVDIIWLFPVINFPSYVYALALTLLSALIVDFFLYFKLEKINMAEALKSVE
ncbi:MAG: FtsX-like permease family protein [Ruminococcaceae bacterium]|nr:FtsX-like permease family protein [Oscillospiraceae bacterium]